MLSIPWSLRDSLFAMKQLWERRSNFGMSLQGQYITCHANYWVNNELIDNKIIVNKNCHSISKLYLSSDDIMQYIKYSQLKNNSPNLTCIGRVIVVFFPKYANWFYILTF